ncbi:hypothetical protein [Leifsonia aquatica]|jgi:hypothetical protein|uniref:DUF1579 domain-containing protein n=3 Tax=Leifsonia TaxID=110932 RepID=U2SY22_LEIAQ|nr:hypothetical protein [Leifsonia aquatica]ERK70148.1 hypothetical protein N136_03518 [Leifsonia aquatica ATCC 14665]MBB2968875.1 hypothetical protein [Leifsonia aquatica]
MSETTDAEFASALIATGPTPVRPQRMHLFGQLVGSWRAECRFLDEESGAWSEFTTDWLFAYTLGGRAVQDVLVAPTAADPSRMESKGTTIRVYDPVLGAWRVSWFGAVAGDFCTLVASGHRDGIRQDGTQTDGRPIRWNFSAITADSFEWDGWVSDDEGRTWWLEQHITATRTG